MSKLIQKNVKRGPKQNIKIGDRFNKLTIISKPYTKKSNNNYQTMVKCKCDCGIIKSIRCDHVKSGKSKSCGCLCIEQSIKVNTKHGLSYHKLYRIWIGIISRCENKNKREYKNYGGRGITMCEEWRNSPKNFVKWAINNDWKKELSIDRIDNDGNYEPSNCRFTAKIIQQNNSRHNKLLTFNNKTLTMSQWVLEPECHVKYKTLQSRIKNNWTHEKAITTPNKRDKT